jgi:signal transduction histidine kinase
MNLIVDAVAAGAIGLGVLLLLVAYYVHHQTARLSRTISELYALNQQVEQDALDFFDQAWSILQNAGVLQLQARIDWFGEHREVCLGQVHRHALQQNFVLERDDMRFELNMAWPAYRGERSSWLRLIVTTFCQILQHDLDYKQAAILASQKRLERYQMFVQHEVKNIAQFVQLLSEQVTTLDNDEAKLRLVNRLQATLPVMAKRAGTAVEQMKQPLQSFYDSQTVALNALIEEVLLMYQLPAELSGQAEVSIARPVLLEIFKNLLGNYRDHPSGDCQLQIAIQPLPNEGAQVQVQSCVPKEMVLKAERLFEPFWTTSQSGMGLGLFLTRELLKQVGGQIEFAQTPQPQHNRLTFTLTLRNVPSL